MPTVARLKQTGDLLITGEVNELLPAVKKDLVAHLPLQEDTSVFTNDRNIVDYSTWKLGATDAPGFYRNGSPTENQIIEYENPWGELDLVWGCINTEVDSNADGGWNGVDVPIDNTKVYRYVGWFRIEGPVGEIDGNIYFGCKSNQVQSYSNVVDSNPYFAVMPVTSLPRDEWLMMVSYIYPHDATGFDNVKYPSGVYRMNGTSITTPSTRKFTPTATAALHRQYLYYSTTPAIRAYFYQPRIELCDGSEPSISDLLKGNFLVNRRPGVSVLNPLFHTSKIWLGKRPNQIEIPEDKIGRYNNYGTPGSIVKLENETYEGRPIYRLEFKVTDPAHLDHYRTQFSAHGVYIGQRYTFKANTPYNYSFFWRRVNKQSVQIGGVPANIGGWDGNTWSEQIDDEWFRHNARRYPNNVNEYQDYIFTGMICPDLELNESVYFDVACPALYEGETNAQGFSNPIRPTTEQSYLKISDSDYFKPPFTLNFFFQDKTRLDTQVNQAGSPQILQMGAYYANPSLTLWFYEKQLRLFHKGDTGAGWSIVNSTGIFQDDVFQKQEHMYTIVMESATSSKLYLDGELVADVTMPIASSSFPFLQFGQVNTIADEFRTSVRDVSIYKRALDAKDVKALTGTTTKENFSLGKTGHLAVRNLLESGKGVLPKKPVDIIPLTSDLGYKGINGLVEPVEFSSVRLTPEGGFVSHSLTNLLSSKTRPFTHKKFGYDGWEAVSKNHLKTVNNSDDRAWINTASIGLSPSTNYTIQAVYWSTDGTLEDFYIQFNNDGAWPEGGMYFQPFSTSHAALVFNKRIESLGNNLYKYTVTFTTKPTTTQIDQIFFDSDKIGHTVFVADVSIVASKYNEFGADNGASSLEFNLFNSKLQWDWSKDWTIAYWKKPIGSSTYSNFSGYNLDSIGSNSNSVGGGYMWQGKSSAADENNVVISNGSDMSTIVPASNYFNEWQLVIWSRRGATIELRYYSPKLGKVQLHRAVTGIGGADAPNRFVNQYGYDLKFGGWDNTYACGAWYRDLMFFKESMTDEEMDMLYNRTMALRKGVHSQTVIGGTLVESARI